MLSAVLLLACRSIRADTTMLVSLESHRPNDPYQITIRQEKQLKGNILISRPSELDLSIAKIIRSKKINSIQDYAYWLKSNIKYACDSTQDIWSEPQETLNRGYGDCEDIAFLNQAFLQVLGYNSKVLALVGGLIKKNHAICVFRTRDDDTFFWFDNTSLKQAPVSSLEDAYNFFIKNYLCRLVLEINLPDKQFDILLGDKKSRERNETF
jgi:predicted transglutaminase-like cysteine proteinase